MQPYIIIVAGGQGTRMGAAIPKQFIKIGHRPILMHSIGRMNRFCPEAHIIVALPAAQIAYWKELCLTHGFDIKHTIVEGGSTRFESVSHAISLVPEDDDAVIAVHDGVRPLVSRELLERCLEEAGKGKAVVPAIALTDSIRQIDAEGSHPVDRSLYRLVQTPQAFPARMLKAAYRQTYSETFTDDASVVEALGTRITLIDGDPQNIKITRPHDLLIAQSILQDVHAAD